MGCIRFQGREVVLKHECLRVVGILYSASAAVPRAEIASRVVLNQLFGGRLLDRALPRSLGAMRRDQYPIPGQRIEPAVRIFVQLERLGHWIRTSVDFFATSSELSEDDSGM